MRDTILIATLTFCVLIAGTAAVGTELLTVKKAPRPEAGVVVTLPAITITGRRDATARLAAETATATATEPRRVQ